MGILLFVLKYMYISLLLKMINGFFWPAKIMVSPFKAKILDLQPEKYELSFDIKKCTTSGWALGDENVISARGSA